ICLRLFWHFMRLADSRTFCTAGSNKPTRMAMMAMTTSNSISVNADLRRTMRGPPGEDEPKKRIKENAKRRIRFWAIHRCNVRYEPAAHRQRRPTDCVAGASGND